ncbi:hypothetical protein EVAR_80011_1 [Eumeta japonica]|uniref:Uncharacterized protein n=1 Tax=Eumeta variegata TaxID=151549 RepID=A0A4C1WP85_EUMVA|nr:hypothetical protein EVAR_80011_1 [Eumeta japonica]
MQSAFRFESWRFCSSQKRFLTISPMGGPIKSGGSDRSVAAAAAGPGRYQRGVAATVSPVTVRTETSPRCRAGAGSAMGNRVSVNFRRRLPHKCHRRGRNFLVLSPSTRSNSDSGRAWITCPLSKRKKYSPLWIGENELPQLQVPQYDALLVAGGDGFRHLPEEASGFVFPQPLPGPHVRVQIGMRARKDQVNVAVAHEHLVQRVDVRVAVQPVVRLEETAAVARHHLRARSQAPHQTLRRVVTSDRVVRPDARWKARYIAVTIKSAQRKHGTRSAMNESMNVFGEVAGRGGQALVGHSLARSDIRRGVINSSISQCQ